MVTKEGFSSVYPKLSRLVNFETEIDQDLGDFAVRQVRRLTGKRYAPPPARSKYIRTFTLKGGYRQLKLGKMRYEISNTASRNGRDYSGWVVGNPQAGIHAGRWWQALVVIEEDADSALNGISRKAVKIWGAR